MGGESAAADFETWKPGNLGTETLGQTGCSQQSQSGLDPDSYGRMSVSAADYSPANVRSLSGLSRRDEGVLWQDLPPGQFR